MKTIRIYLSYFFIMGFVALSILFSNTSCNREDTGVSAEDSIYYFTNELMHSWYYWYEETPQLEIYSYEHPMDLMVDLRKEPPDVWSFVDDKETILSLFEEGESFDIGFRFRFKPTGTAYIIYVYENTIAYNLGIRKGDIIRSINGTETKNHDINYLNAIFNADPGSYTFEIEHLNGSIQTYSIAKETIVQNSVMFKDTYTVSGVNTGYLVYDSFLGYSEQELDDAIAYFKQNNVEELVIDLRYNGGGAVNLAKKFGEFLVPTEYVGSTAYSYTHNVLAAPTNDTTITFGAQEVKLDLERVFFITSEFTASASELLINMLEPYMDVILIGTPSTGKPMGMYGFIKQEWIVYPVTTKLVNANGYGDFFDGLPVDFMAPEGLEYTWGDENDPCLYQAFYYIGHNNFDNTASTANEKSAMRSKTEKIPGQHSYLILGIK